MFARAAITDARGGFTIETIEVSAPQAEEVLVEIKAAGVCHTDYDSMSRGVPRILGHEGAGVVKAVGPGVTHVQPGDRVVLNWATPCGRCFQCLRGNTSICESRPLVPDERIRCNGQPMPRSFRLGTMATLAVVRREAVSRINVDVSFAAAAVVGCGVMTGYGSVVNTAKVKPGSSVAVIGTGGVGLNVIQGARIAGADQIIGVDINPERLKMALRFGATHTIQAERDDKGLLRAAQQVKALTAGRGADYAFECTAVPELGAAPLAMARNGGTAVQVSGIEQEITIDMNLFEWNKTYINPLYGECNPDVDFPILFSLYQKGALLLDELVTRTYRLEDLGQAYADMHSGINAKGVLVMED